MRCVCLVRAAVTPAAQMRLCQEFFLSLFLDFFYLHTFVCRGVEGVVDGAGDAIELTIDAFDPRKIDDWLWWWVFFRLPEIRNNTREQIWVGQHTIFRRRIDLQHLTSFVHVSFSVRNKKKLNAELNQIENFCVSTKNLKKDSKSNFTGANEEIILN